MIIVTKDTARGQRILKEVKEREDKFWEKQWVHEELQAKHGERRQ